MSSTEQTLRQWEDAQGVVKAFRIPGNAPEVPVGDEYNHFFLLFDSEDPNYPSVLKLKNSLIAGYAAKGTKITIVAKVDPQYRSLDDRQYYLFDILFPSGQKITIPVGRILGEQAQPEGWTGDDASTHYIGVNQPGYWNPGNLPAVWSDGAPLPFAWVPDAKPKPVAPVPGTTTTDWTALMNAASGAYDNGNFTNHDRSLLIAIAGKLAVL